MSTDGRAASGSDGLARARPERALLLAADTGTAPWSVTESLDELEELARTAGAEIVGRLSQRLEHPDPRTYLGRGKLQEAREIAEEQLADLVIVDDELAPSTQRAMEEVLGHRVVDRTLLILDIFAQRARTHEGRVQVELARLEYLLPRLTRAWTHLERQVGFLDPLPFLVDPQDCVFVRNLLHHYYQFHFDLLKVGRWSVVSCFVPFV